MNSTQTTRQIARAEKKAERDAYNARIDKIHAEVKAIVATGKCPTCGETLRRNSSMTGWWQCGQLGAVGFRKNANLPSCNWQGFTE
jgi:ribosomal protein L37AE/L43A